MMRTKTMPDYTLTAMGLLWRRFMPTETTSFLQIWSGQLITSKLHQMSQPTRFIPLVMDLERLPTYQLARVVLLSASWIEVT